MTTHDLQTLSNLLTGHKKPGLHDRPCTYCFGEKRHNMLNCVGKKRDNVPNNSEYLEACYVAATPGNGIAGGCTSSNALYCTAWWRSRGFDPHYLAKKRISHDRSLEGRFGPRTPIKKVQFFQCNTIIHVNTAITSPSGWLVVCGIDRLEDSWNFGILHQLDSYSWLENRLRA